MHDVSHVHQGPKAGDLVVADASRGHPVAVEVRGISKRFGDVIANLDVDLDLRRGEVHALLGENGAGKTTLMNILSGMLRPDAGEIIVDGQPTVVRSPRVAAQTGIGMVHQHFQLIDRMTVAENMFLGWDAAPRFGGHRTLANRVKDMVGEFELDIDPDSHVGDLSVGEQQRVEIVRTLLRGTWLLILDEPTAVLTPREAKSLFRMIRSLADGGRAVVFISHKLREVVRVADRVSVMRAGRIVQTLDAAAVDERTLARLMVRLVEGTNQPGTPAAYELRGGDPIAVIENVSAKNDRGLAALVDVSLSIAPGEIVGVAGVAGNGQRELAEVLTGLRKPTAGTVRVRGVDLTGARARAFIEAGVGHIPEDRQGTGLAYTETIWRNAVLKRYRDSRAFGGMRFRRRAAKTAAHNLCRVVELSTQDVDTPVRHLSGGNAQRLLTGRELQAATRLLVAVHPTRGLDVGRTQAVHEALRSGGAEGLGTLIISEDIDELLKLSNRVVVLYEGRVVGEFQSEDADEETLGTLMGGGREASRVEM